MVASTVLCVDPDESERSATCRALREGTELSVVGCDSLATARGSLVDSVGCVVTEYELPDGTGVELVGHVREVAPDTACVLYTDSDPEEIDTSEAGMAIVEYLQKDGDADRETLVGLVNHVVSFRTQTSYPIPPDEEERLEALAQYTDRPEELRNALRRISEIAAETFGVEMAVVGIMEEHEQEFIACYGTPEVTVDREDAVCTYAMLEDGVTVIEDLVEDPRVQHVAEDLREVGLRFYASADVVTPEGYKIGTFCLYDGEPRSLNERERELLELFAEEAMDQIELRRLMTGGGAIE